MNVKIINTQNQIQKGKKGDTVKAQMESWRNYLQRINKINMAKVKNERREMKKLQKTFSTLYQNTRTKEHKIFFSKSTAVNDYIS